MSFSLFKPGKSRILHYRFQIGGARTQRSTRERTKARAEPVAQRAYDEALLLANGGVPIPTLAELAKSWLDTRRPTASAAHIRSVDTFVRLHMYDLGAMPISAISTELIETTRNLHLATRQPASANHWLRIIKLIANWAVRRKIIARLPWSVAMLKVQKRPRAILPIDAAAAWFGAVDDATRASPAIGVAVRMMLFLGLRESEATSARWEWIDWQRATYTPGVTKGREAEPLPMPAWLVNYLTPLRKADGLIATKACGARFPAGFARKAMISANARCSTRGITPHRLRGTIATLMSENGVPIQTIQKFLRHKSPMTTMAYLEKNMDTAARAGDAIAEKINIKWRESGEDHPEEPHESSS